MDPLIKSRAQAAYTPMFAPILLRIRSRSAIRSQYYLPSIAC
jgi:hypothetical protein